MKRDRDLRVFGRDDMETGCSRNPQDSMRVILVNIPSNGEFGA